MYINKLSIIVPCYNSANFIQPLLISLKRQINKNLEVIFIDDASTDNTIDVINSELKSCEFPYCISSNQRNSGPGLSRNLGIQQANGEFLTFIDSDDYISDNFSDIIISHMSNDIDIGFFDFAVQTKKKCIWKKTFPHLSKGFVDSETALAYPTGATWGKVYRTSFVKEKEIKFLAQYISEDVIFSKTAIMKSNKNLYIDENLYYYVQREDSLMHQKERLNYTNDLNSFNELENSALSLNYYKELEFLFIDYILYSSVLTMIIQRKTRPEILFYIAAQQKRYPKWEENNNIKILPVHKRLFLYCLRKKYFFGMKVIAKAKEITMMKN